MLSRFREDKNVKIVYNPPLPWFWICVPNRLHCKLDDATAPSPPSTLPPSVSFQSTSLQTSLPLAPSLSSTHFHMASPPGPFDGDRHRNDDDDAFPPLRPLAPAFLPTSLPPPNRRPFPAPPAPLPSTLPIAAGLDGYGVVRDHYICSGKPPHEYQHFMQIWDELTKP
jgi:hypothetical protein